MAFKFGHRIMVDNGCFIYADGEIISPVGNMNVYDFPSTRGCPKCGQMPTEDGHDPCLGKLPGVIGACCGHGVNEGYVRFEDGTIIRGDYSLTIIEDWGTMPP